MTGHVCQRKCIKVYSAGCSIAVCFGLFPDRANIFHPCACQIIPWVRSELPSQRLIYDMLPTTELMVSPLFVLDWRAWFDVLYFLHNRKHFSSARAAAVQLGQERKIGVRNLSHCMLMGSSSFRARFIQVLGQDLNGPVSMDRAGFLPGILGRADGRTSIFSTPCSTCVQAGVYALECGV